MSESRGFLIMRMRVYWLTCIVVLLAAGMHATTIVMPSDEQLIAKTPVIVRALVLHSAAVERNGGIWTETALQVESSIKGNVSGIITVREVGGVISDRITKVFGTPEYHSGEQVLAFLNPTLRGDYQTVDLFVGKFTEASTLDGRRLWLRDDSLPNVALLDSAFRPIAGSNAQRDAVGFEKFVTDRLEGRAGIRNYGVENPAIARDAAESGRGLTPSADFTLIAEPSVYRWFAFQNGGSANWYSYGSQSGYSGGGVNEIQTAISPWTSYSAAIIRYNYAGSFATGPGGLSAPNGRNEILFNDPLGEISGSFNPSTGGVVGQGGFNGVSAAESWTSPFAADADHPQATFSAYNIVEGNLTIQDGVSPAAGISSNRLAEIIAHELGHTLGFGHSADNTALMYYQVTGLGPSLRPDDQTAARWLYPNGTVNPPPASVPAAPSGLSGTSSGDSVTLQWSDNSNNESGFSVYYAVGSGAFTKVGNVAAGAQSARVTGLGNGSYRFYVTAFNSTGESAASNVVTIAVGTQTQLQASFTVSPESGVAGSTLFVFTDTSTGNIASRSWNFGDGATASGPTASHVYSSAATFSVTLTVSGGGYQSQATKSIIVASAPPGLTADFTFSPANPTVDDNIAFSDRSTGASAWQWNFGDGTFAVIQNPSKRYAIPGTYTVTLIVYAGAESRVASRPVTVISSSPALPPPAFEFRSVVPMAAQSSGVAGSQWRTELTLFNAGTAQANVLLTFIPGAGGTQQQQTLTLAQGQSRTYRNALPELFGIASGSGAISLIGTTAAGAAELKVTSRTFSETAAGTYGQGVPDIAGTALQKKLYLTGIAWNSEYRTNIGLVNKSATAVSATLTLLDRAGNTVGTTAFTIPAGNFRQDALVTDFPAVNGRQDTSMSLVVRASAADALSAWASVVDNRTNDPVYYQAMPLPAASPVVIPLVGHLQGAVGTFWRSDVTLFNPSASFALVTLTYRTSSGSAQPRNVALSPGETVTIPDIVPWVGYGDSLGMVEASWTGDAVPVITSRTYTSAPLGGTYGQSTDAVTSFGRAFHVTGLRSDAAFRSSAGFVNSGANPITVDAAMLSPAGAVIKRASLQVGARSHVQISISALFGVDPVSVGTFTLSATTNDTPTLFVYGSIVDDASGDPVFFAGK